MVRTARPLLGAVAAWAFLGWPGGAPEFPGPSPSGRDFRLVLAQEDHGSSLFEWSKVPVPAPPSGRGDLLDLGERLYGWNCFPCHGGEGKGGGPVAVRQGLRPRDFTRGLFKLKSSAPGEMPFDEDLYRTISTGIVQGGMPVPRELDPLDRWALVAYVKTLAVFTKADGTRERHFETKPARTRWMPPAPPKPDRLDLRRGRELFTTRVQCAACHGPGGKGDGPAAPGLLDAWDLPAPVPDLTRGELSLKMGSELGDIFRTLSLGMAGTPMPSYASLPEEDRWDLAAYVRSVFEPISPGEKLYLTSGCSACHTLGRGKLVGPDLVGVRTRHDRAWMREWLADPPGMLARDPATRKQFQHYTVQMPMLKLTPGDVDLLIDYLEKAGK